MGWFIFGFLAFCGVGIFLVMKSIDHQNNRKKALDSIDDENYSRTYTSTDGSTKIFFDETSEKVKIGYISIDNFKDSNVAPVIKTYDFKDIVDVEVNIDGSTVSKVSKGDSILGATVGGAIGGGIGAIIGSNSASSKTSDYINYIHLRICFEDYDTPFYDVAFYSGVVYDPELPTSIKKSSPEAQKALKEAETWFRYFKLAIRNAEKVAH